MKTLSLKKLLKEEKKGEVLCMFRRHELLVGLK